MRIGQLRNRITIQKYTKVEDEGGGHKKDWQNYITLWAAKKEEGQECEFTIRYRKDISEKDMRVVCNSKKYKINSVNDKEDRKRYLNIATSLVTGND